MEAKYLFVLLMLAFTIGLSIILGDSSRNDVIAHWSQRRCDFDVLITSVFYKPPEDTRSSVEFASDNFKFCVGTMSTDYLSTLFGALFEVLRTQMGAADIMTDVMKVLRKQLNSIYAPFATMMSKFWNKFKQIGSLASRVFQHLFMAMKKAAATGVASIFVALSIQAAFLNTIDLVINAIMIVLYICIALAFIFFLPILPLLVVVIISVAGIEAAMPGRTGDMGAVFGCFTEETPIQMKSGTSKICEVQLGDILANGQKVESVIELPGSDELYLISGVYVTGDHRIWDTVTKKWLMVKDYPGSILSERKTPTVWSLITSDRTIPINGLLFADWEEIPDTDEANLLWERMAREILGSPIVNLKAPENAPCFNPEIRVKKFQGGWVPMNCIRRGDWILAENGWTRVIGMCERTVMGGINVNKNRMTSGIWLMKDNVWTHPEESDDTMEWSGLHLLTESATFRVLLDSSEGTLVRDFTEVGFNRLPETYARVEEAMTPPLIK